MPYTVWRPLARAFVVGGPRILDSGIRPAHHCGEREAFHFLKRVDSAFLAASICCVFHRDPANDTDIGAAVAEDLGSTSIAAARPVSNHCIPPIWSKTDPRGPRGSIDVGGLAAAVSECTDKFLHNCGKCFDGPLDALELGEARIAAIPRPLLR